jgi:hypothetical protein
VRVEAQLNLIIPSCRKSKETDTDDGDDAFTLAVRQSGVRICSIPEKSQPVLSAENIGATMVG